MRIKVSHIRSWKSLPTPKQKNGKCLVEIWLMFLARLVLHVTLTIDNIYALTWLSHDYKHMHVTVSCDPHNLNVNLMWSSHDLHVTVSCDPHMTCMWLSHVILTWLLLRVAAEAPQSQPRCCAPTKSVSQSSWLVGLEECIEREKTVRDY